MSEYQYYDFRAIDRALTKSEMAELRFISTRAVITSSSFTNHYEWGDLKANPLKLLEKYFDAFLYVANWGTRKFFLRLPEDLADYTRLHAMLPGEAAHVQEAAGHVILGFSNESQLDDWDDGTGWMASLLSLRSEVLGGDLRCLYLGWLLCAQCEEFAEDELEPLVPPGLGQLPASLQSLIEFLEIDNDLVEVAALTSAPLTPGPIREELDAWIRSLPEEEKNDLLVTAACESDQRWKTNLLRRFQRQTDPDASSPAGDTQRRTVGELLEAAHSRSEERTKRIEAERAAAAARRKAEEEAIRERYLEQLEKRERETWNQIAAHIRKKQPNEYDRAVKLLTDLRDVALRQERIATFHLALKELRRTHAAKPSFLSRLTKAKL